MHCSRTLQLCGFCCFLFLSFFLFFFFLGGGWWFEEGVTYFLELSFHRCGFFCCFFLSFYIVELCFPFYCCKLHCKSSMSSLSCNNFSATNISNLSTLITFDTLFWQPLRSHQLHIWLWRPPWPHHLYNTWPMATSLNPSSAI